MAWLWGQFHAPEIKQVAHKSEHIIGTGAAQVQLPALALHASEIIHRDGLEVELVRPSVAAVSCGQNYTRSEPRINIWSGGALCGETCDVGAAPRLHEHAAVGEEIDVAQGPFEAQPAAAGVHHVDQRRVRRGQPVVGLLDVEQRQRRVQTRNPAQLLLTLQSFAPRRDNAINETVRPRKDTLSLGAVDEWNERTGRCVWL